MDGGVKEFDEAKNEIVAGEIDGIRPSPGIAV